MIPRKVNNGGVRDIFSPYMEESEGPNSISKECNVGQWYDSWKVNHNDLFIFIYIEDLVEWIVSHLIFLAESSQRLFLHSFVLTISDMEQD